MATALAIFSALVIAMSLYGILSPVNILAFARFFLAGSGIWFATGMRLLLAVLLWFTSPVCQTPVTFKVLAVVALLAAALLPLLGSTRLLTLLERLQSWPPVVVRLQCLVGVGFGGFVLWSIWPAVTA